MNQLKPPEQGYQSRIRTSNRRLYIWTGAWLAATALMAFGPKFLWNKAVVFTMLAVGLNVAGMIVAHKNLIMEMDELQRKINLNALAITVGVALIAGIPYSVMDTYDVIPFHADIGHLLMLMSLTFAIAHRYGMRHYR